MKRSWLVLTGMAVLAFGARSAQAAEPWLHVQVEEPGKGSKVSVNLPLSVVEIALKAAPEALHHKGHIRLGHDDHELKIADMKRIWAELKASGESEFVKVEEADGDNVSVARRGELLQIRVDDRRKKEQLRVDVPVAVVDALFAAEGDALDIRGALQVLRSRRGGIVSVDGDDKIRVWIDERN